MPVRLHASSTSSRVSLWEWAQTAFVAVILVWTTLSLGGYRAETMVVTMLLVAGLLAVHALSRGYERPRVPPLHPAGWWLLPFVAYALANVVWVTPVRWLGWLDWLGWFQLSVVFWVVLNGVRSAAPRRVLFFTLVGLGIVGVLLASYQRFVRPDWIMFGRSWPGTLGGRASGSFGIPNSLAGFLLLLLPAAGALALRRSAGATGRVWWGWVAVVLSFGLLLTISRGAWVALAVALTAWPLLAATGGWWRRARLAVLVLALLGIVGAAIYTKSPRVRERFAVLVLDAGERTRPLMWRGAWELFRDAPLVGTGAGSYNVMFERHRPEGFRDEPLWAHSEYLNTLSDYGVVGFLLFFGAAVGIAVRCLGGGGGPRVSRREGLESPVVVSALGIGLLAFGFQLALDFHLKIPALAFAAATVAALAVPRAWPGVHFAGEGRRQFALGGWLVAALGMATATLFFLPRLRAEGLRQEARREIERLGATSAESTAYEARLPRLRERLAHASRLDPTNAQAWADQAYATALAARAAPGLVDALGREAEAQAEQALRLTLVCSEFWIRRGVARDMQGRWAEAGRDFAAAVALAPADAYAWFYYADHLSRVKAASEAAEAALAFCLRLDPNNPAGLALRQRLAVKPTEH